jgi:hypothetical protein
MGSKVRYNKVKPSLTNNQRRAGRMVQVVAGYLPSTWDALISTLSIAKKKRNPVFCEMEEGMSKAYRNDEVKMGTANREDRR